MMNSNETISIVMFPWLGYGHITPYLELAKKLTTRNFIIYLCSTKANLRCIENKITEKLSDSVILVPLSLPTLPDLPPELHTTNGLPPHLMGKLKEALNLSAPTFACILAKLKPHLLIYDFLQPWAPAIAEEQNIPAVEFVTSSSTIMSFMFHYYKKPDVDFPFEKIYYRGYESVKLQAKDMFLTGVEKSCKVVLIKGSMEVDGKYTDYVSELLGKKHVAVGCLVEDSSHVYLDEDISSCLESKGKKSTVFVSFGSEYFLSKEDFDEIAYGLELSNVNFIWVVRFPRGQGGYEYLLEKTLPEGFLERIGNRGKIIVGWAPQTKILGHESIGGFVSHCGWNSVLESMSLGVPIVAVPMHLDQPINARLVEEVGVGIEVVKNEDGKLCKDRIAEVIKQVVVEESGEIVRTRASAMRDTIKANLDQELDEVVKELVEICIKN